MEFGGLLGNALVGGPFERSPARDAAGGRGITPPPAHPCSDCKLSSKRIGRRSDDGFAS